MKQLGRAVLAVFFACACGGPDAGSDGGGRPDGQVGVDGGPVAVCSAASDCDDGQHCNGAERCEPGAAGAGADGCVPGTAPCGAGETCDEATDSCVPDDCAEPDADGDGHDRIGCGSGDDCDDADGDRYPGNAEICDALGHDEDCNPDTISGNPDVDGDGHVDDACWNVRPDGTENRGTDCDDARNTVHPDAPESCNGVDDDCDGMIDEGVLETFYRDVDGDNYGRSAETMMACSRPTGYALVGGDCDDGETGNAWAPTVNPAAVEVCNGRDDNCDGITDPGCSCTIGAPPQPCGIDVGECTAGTQTCVDGAWSACGGSQGPVTEVCNGLDDDCDGMSDEGLRVSCYADNDSDGYGTGTVTSQCRDESRAAFGFCPPGYGDVASDCNDGNGAVSPGATEVCNSVDDDCDGMTDEMLRVTCYADGDSDGYGAGASSSVCRDDSRPSVGFCPSGYSNRDGDCDDGDGAVRPMATETCNGVDDDCDGMVDEGVRTQFWRDADNDTYGNPSMSMMACSRPTGYALVGGDCDDGETGNPWAATVNPAAVEVCNGRDDNCDGLIDPDCECTNTTTQPCGTDVGQCTIGTQTCVDGMWGACTGQGPMTEVCNLLDDDCNGVVDDDLRVTGCYADGESDGYGTGTPSSQCRAADRPTLGFCPIGYSNRDGDCDDSTAAARPSNDEADFSCDGIDNDCDGAVDEAGINQMDCYRDLDGDTYGSGANVPACTCPTGWVTRGGDCDETGARAHLIHPGASFQTVPHCNGAAPCGAVVTGDADGWACMHTTGCGGLGQPICFCVDPASYDYDCDGVAEPTPRGTFCSGMFSCVGQRGPVAATPSAADCGVSVPHQGGCQPGFPCTTSPSGNQLLGCR